MCVLKMPLALGWSENNSDISARWYDRQFFGIALMGKISLWGTPKKGKFTALYEYN